jgi:hypothetical protein
VTALSDQLASRREHITGFMNPSLRIRLNEAVIIASYSMTSTPSADFTDQRWPESPTGSAD